MQQTQTMLSFMINSVSSLLTTAWCLLSRIFPIDVWIRVAFSAASSSSLALAPRKLWRKSNKQSIYASSHVGSQGSDKEGDENPSAALKSLDKTSLQEVQIIACEACHFNDVPLLSAALNELVERRAAHVTVQQAVNFTTEARSGRWRAKASPLVLAAGANAIDCGVELLRRGANLNVRTAKGVTAALIAARTGKSEFLSFVIEAGADLTIGDISGIRPIHGAALNGRTECARIVLDQLPVEINARDHGSRTPLHYAAFNGHSDMVELLMDRGADPALMDTDGETVWHKIAHHGNIKLLHRFSLSTAAGPVAGPSARRNADRLSPLMLAATRGHCRWVIAATSGDGAATSGDGSEFSEQAIDELLHLLASIAVDSDGGRLAAVQRVCDDLVGCSSLQPLVFDRLVALIQSFVDQLDQPPDGSTSHTVDLLVASVQSLLSLADKAPLPAHRIGQMLDQLAPLWSLLLTTLDSYSPACAPDLAVGLIRCFFVACRWNPASAVATGAQSQFSLCSFRALIEQYADTVIEPLLSDGGADLLLDRFDFLLTDDGLRRRFTGHVRALDFECKQQWLRRRVSQEMAESKARRASRQRQTTMNGSRSQTTSAEVERLPTSGEAQPAHETPRNNQNMIVQPDEVEGNQITDSNEMDELTFLVTRGSMLQDQACSLLSRSIDALKSGLNIKFRDELAVGAGVTREWFQSLSKELFNEDNALFQTAADGVSLQPNPSSSINADHLSYFEFAGRFVGMAIFHGELVDVQFTNVFCKHIVGSPVSLSDVEGVDKQLFQSLTWILANENVELLDLVFSTDNTAFGGLSTHELIPDGANVSVTDKNKHMYVRLLAQHKLSAAIRPQLDAFLRGFHALISADVVAVLTPGELQLLTSGLRQVDMADWESNTEYSGGYTAESPPVRWFWSLVREELTVEDHVLLLQFVTGSARVPAGGFAALKGMDGVHRFTISRSPMFIGDDGIETDALLPTASTCFNTLRLPEYQTKKQLYRCVLTAIRCGGGFSFG